MAVAFDDLEILAGEHDCNGDVTDQRIAGLLGNLAEIGETHGGLRLAVEHRFCEFSAAVVAASAAVELIFRGIFADAVKRLENRRLFGLRFGMTVGINQLLNVDGDFAADAAAVRRMGRRFEQNVNA